MLATSKIGLFPGHNHLLNTGTDDPSLAGRQAMIKVSGHQYQWYCASGTSVFVELCIYLVYFSNVTF